MRIKKIINGNLPDADTISLLKIGQDDKNSVTQILGEPSFKGSLGIMHTIMLEV